MYPMSASELRVRAWKRKIESESCNLPRVYSAPAIR